MPFKPGTSGNPGGRKKTSAEVTELSKQEATDAFRRIVELSKNSPDPRIKLQASIHICDRAWGKPMQATEISGIDNQPYKIIVNVQEKKIN